MTLQYHIVSQTNVFSVIGIFSLLWVVFIFLKYYYPYDFQLNIFNPKALFRSTISRSKRFFSTYRLTANIIFYFFSLLILLWFDFRRPGPYSPWLIAGVAAVFFLLTILAVLLFRLKNENFLYLGFLKSIYAFYFVFWSSFLLFFLYFVSWPFNIKLILFLLPALYFYAVYLYTEWRIAVQEFHIKPFYNILYLCITEIIPFSIGISLLTQHL